MDILCSHLDPVNVEGSLRTDSNGGLIKEQRCRCCGAIRRGVKPRWVHRKTSSGSAWAPWEFDDWGPGELSAGTEHTRRAAWSPEHWATGMVEESRRAGRQPGLRPASNPQPCASDLLNNRERALAHVKMLVAIHGFRPAELVPNSDVEKTS